MDVERINYRIKYYLKIYDGRKKPTYERVKNDIVSQAYRKQQNYLINAISDCFDNLENCGVISVIPFSDLTSQQQEEVRNNSEIYYIIN